MNPREPKDESREAGEGGAPRKESLGGEGRGPPHGSERPGKRGPRGGGEGGGHLRGKEKREGAKVCMCGGQRVMSCGEDSVRRDVASRELRYV